MIKGLYENINIIIQLLAIFYLYILLGTVERKEEGKVKPVIFLGTLLSVDLMLIHMPLHFMLKYCVIFIVFVSGSMAVYRWGSFVHAALYYFLWIGSSVCSTVFMVSVFKLVGIEYLSSEAVYPYTLFFEIADIVFNLFLVLLIRMKLSKGIEDFQAIDVLPFLLISVSLVILFSSLDQFIYRYSRESFPITIYVSIILLVISFLGSVIVTEHYVRVKKKERLELSQIQDLQAKCKYYLEKQEEEEKIRCIYHDMKNYLLLLRSEGDVNALIDKLSQELAVYESFYQTGNTFLDTVLKDKWQQAQKENVDFHIKADFRAGGFLDAFDISALFGNALDNALEAVINLPPEDRLITVKVSKVHDFLSIIIQNSISPEIGQVAVGNTTKSDHFLHGIGQRSIESVVQKYCGECNFTITNGRYVLSVIIPIPR